MTQQVNLDVMLAGLQHADGDIAATSDRCTEEWIIPTGSCYYNMAAEIGETHCLVEIHTCTRATTTTQCQTHGCHYRYTHKCSHAQTDIVVMFHAA